ncbi:hypothetical protein QBC34DRAFT_41774 [Podospora aff. communis PSN243]|uniref:DUF7730 domain-containing protein n=1 Tax=Podospora aff. communis PSN243 TaxID=3040156 RepID=A0AAV9GW90_9PEZI|nr:hypothetical protein QBC34DRAFT_41774 [Podospora aff. communis PSN243]
MPSTGRNFLSDRVRRVISNIRLRRDDTNPTPASAPPPPPAPPFLPTPRRPLTPSQPQPSNLTALGTFARLPSELRRRILIAAFGDRTLHLDLRLAPSPIPGTIPAQGVDDAHSGLSAPLSRTPDSDASPQWRWWGSECHRNIPPWYTLRQHHYLYPMHDECIRGIGEFCFLWRGLGGDGTKKGRCGVGAMGWLRACRQAYVEGVEVLYATNTLFLERAAMDAFCLGGGAGELIPPGRLAAVRALEIRWEVVLFGRGKVGWHYDVASVEQWGDGAMAVTHLGMIAKRFGGLRSLVLAFRDPKLSDYRDDNPDEAASRIDLAVLRPVAEAIGRLPPSSREQPVVLDLSNNLFRFLHRLRLEGEEKDAEFGGGRQVWLRYPISDGSFYYIKGGTLLR